MNGDADDRDLHRPAAPAARPVAVRLWASARAAAGREELRCDVARLRGDGPWAVQDVLSEAVAALSEQDPERAARLVAVLPRCSLLVDAVSAGTVRAPRGEVDAGGLVEVLPPFAGG